MYICMYALNLDIEFFLISTRMNGLKVFSRHLSGLTEQDD